MPDEKVMDVPFELLILGAAVKSGMIDAFADKAMTSMELAGKLQADARAVWVIAEALAALGYLVKDGEVYKLSEEARKMFNDPNAANYTGFAFMHRYNQIRKWIHLPEIISTGKPYPREKEAGNTSYFMSAMRYSAKPSAVAIAEFLLEGAGVGIRVLDVGGGPLVNAKAFTMRGARVVVLDVPEVVEMMRREAEAAGIEMTPGDYNVSLPPGLFDLIYLGNICHINSEEENQSLFLRVRESLITGGRIAIVDLIRGTNPFAAVFGVNMLVSTPKGGTWTLAQYTGWLETAGFSNIQLNEVSGRQLITAVKI